MLEVNKIYKADCLEIMPQKDNNAKLIKNMAQM